MHLVIIFCEPAHGSPVYEPGSALWHLGRMQQQRPNSVQHEHQLGPGVQLNDPMGHEQNGPPDSARCSDDGQVDDISDRVTRMDIDTVAAVQTDTPALAAGGRDLRGGGTTPTKCAGGCSLQWRFWGQDSIL
jgi:hypothetical protein